MKRSEISRLRNLHSENKLVLSLLTEIELLVSTNKLLQGELDRRRLDSAKLPEFPKFKKPDSQIFELPNV
jgi:hypothetical protein